MTTKLSCDLLSVLQGRTIVTAESCTGGGIGAALTAVRGSSKSYKGGIICYTNEVKIQQLGVSAELLDRIGAVSAEVAQAMASGVKITMHADVAISVTGLAGPDGDEFGNPVGTVYIGYADDHCCISKQFLFDGDRESVRSQAVKAALNLAIDQLTKQ